MHFPTNLFLSFMHRDTFTFSQGRVTQQPRIIVLFILAIQIEGHYTQVDYPSMTKKCSFSAALPRSVSTPGLLESEGRIPLEEMWLSPAPLQPLHHLSPDSASVGSR